MSKKLLSFFLSLVIMLVGPMYALADNNIDLASLSLEELLKLHEDILLELDKKGYSKSATLQIGKYVAGVDIPAGTYTIELSETANPDEFGYFNYGILNEKGESLEYDTMRVTALKVTLKENYTLAIERAPVKITTYAILWQ